MALVGNMIVGLSARTEDFDRGMRRARQELTQTQQAAQQATSGFTNLGRTLGAAAAAAISLGAIKSGIQDIVQTGLQFERLRVSFTAITGSAEQGRREFEFIRTTANRVGLDLTTLADSYRGLTAATRGTTLEGQATRDLFTALTNASRVYGLSTEQTGRALVALQQIISKGKVSQEELRQQLGEAIPGASQIAARAFGVTTAELDKMIEKGLDATEFVRRFTAQLAKETPAALEQIGLGFARLGNALTEFKNHLAQTGILKFFDDLADRAGKALKAELDAINEASRAAERSAQRALGGTLPGTLPADRRGMLAAFTAQRDRLEQELRQAEERLRAAQAAAEARGTTLSPFGMETQTVERLRREFEAVKALQEDIARENRQVLAETKREQERRGELTEIGPQFEAQQRAEAERRVLETQQEQLRNKERFAEIDVDTDKRIKAQEEAEKDAVDAAKQRVELFKSVGEEQRRYLEGLQEELDRLTLTREEIEKKMLAQQPLEGAQRAVAEGLLEEIQTRREVQRLVEETQRTIQGLPQDAIGRAAEQERKQRARERIQDAKDTARAVIEEQRRLQREVETFAAYFTDTILSITDLGKRSFKDFVDSAIQDLFRLFARRHLDRLFSQGINAVLRVVQGLSGAAAGGVSADSAAGLGGEGALFAASRQAGGPVLPRRAYLVGERAPELFIPGEAGTVRPLEPRGGPQHVTFNIYAQDTRDVLRSSGEIRRQLLNVLNSAQRDG